MDTSTVLVSILQEMKKMTQANAQLLTIIQQQTELINEQKDMLYGMQASLSAIQHQQFR